MLSWNEIEHSRQIEVERELNNPNGKARAKLHPSHPFYKPEKSGNIKVILTPKQLDDLLSNRISRMKEVIEYIRQNVIEE
jgi:hypothetical protein